MLLLSVCSAGLIQRRQHLLSEFRMFMREVQSVSWSCPQHTVLSVHICTRFHVPFIVRMFLLFVDFTSVYCPEVYFYFLTLVSGSRSFGMWRRGVWHMSASCHSCMKLGVVNSCEMSVDTILSGVTVFLFICWTTHGPLLCTATLYWGENVVRIRNSLCSVHPAKCWDNCLECIITDYLYHLTNSSVVNNHGWAKFDCFKGYWVTPCWVLNGSILWFEVVLQVWTVVLLWLFGCWRWRYQVLPKWW
jgi:hypothetical protein